MDRMLAAAVRRRARGACEYCRLPGSESKVTFPIDHVIARQHGGPTEAANLAVACPSCNLHKGPNLYGVDPETGQPTRLFHPRQDRWSDHFRWDGVRIVPASAVGRTTVAVLDLNAPEQIAARTALLKSGWFFRIDL